MEQAQALIVELPGHREKRPVSTPDIDETPFWFKSPDSYQVEFEFAGGIPPLIILTIGALEVPFIEQEYVPMF
jgi:hypothetical protein